MAFVKGNFDASQIPSLYSVGDEVFLKVGARRVDPRPYRIHMVLNDGLYHLSRDGIPEGKIYQEESLRAVQKVHRNPPRFIKGDTVFVKGDTAVYSGPYVIHDVLANHEYRLSRDEVFKKEIYQEEDLQTTTQKFLEKVEQTSRLYKMGDEVLEKGTRGIELRRYQPRDIFADSEHRLPRDRVFEKKVYREEDFQTAMQEVLEKVQKLQTRAKSSTGASLGKDDKEHTTVGPEDAVEQPYAQEYDYLKYVIPNFDVPWTKPIKQEAREFDPNIAYEKTELDGSKVRSDKMKMEDIGEEKAENIRLATGKRQWRGEPSASSPELVNTFWKNLNARSGPVAKAEGLSDTSVSLPRLDYGQVRNSPSAEDDQLATGKAKELEITEASFSKFDDDDVLKEVSVTDNQPAPGTVEGPLLSLPGLDDNDVLEEVSATDDQPATGRIEGLDDNDALEEISATDDQPVTGKVKELDTGASFSEFDDDDMLEEVSAQDNQLVRQQSREEAKTQNIRSVLSRFGIGERPLVDGKKRVRWRCGCGRKCYDDFTELRTGAAAELEKWLNDSMRKHTGSSAPNSQQSTLLTSPVSPNAGSSGYQQTAESDISLQSLGPSADALPASNMNAAVSIDVNLEKCWLILCGNMKRGPDVLLTQMNLSSTPSDKSLFDDMRSVYSSFRQSWTLRSVLRGVKTIRFVQFQLHKSARVDIRKAPDMPPETRRDEYLYEPCDLIPPVGENFMTHWFHHPEDAWEFPWAYSLIPKRIKGELEVDLNQAPRVGWGIQIVEGWLGSRLWLLSLSLFVCGSLAFAICWSILEHDIQGAFGVSAYVVALLTLAVGAAQANLG